MGEVTYYFKDGAITISGGISNKNIIHEIFLTFTRYPCEVKQIKIKWNE